MPAGGTARPPIPLGPHPCPGLCLRLPSAPFPAAPRGGAGTGRNIVLGQAQTPPSPSTLCPQHPPSRQHQTRYNPALISAAANSAQRRKSKPQTVPFLPLAHPQHGVIFSPPRVGTADNAALCENRRQEETHSIAPMTSRILTLSLPSSHFLVRRQRDRGARHPMPTPGCVLPLPAAQGIVPVQHQEGRGCCLHSRGLFLAQGDRCGLKARSCGSPRVLGMGIQPWAVATRRGDAEREGTLSRCRCSRPGLRGCVSVQTRAAPLSQHFRALAGHRKEPLGMAQQTCTVGPWQEEARWGGWESTRPCSGNGQNQSLGKQPRLARQGADVPRGCGGRARGDAPFAIQCSWGEHAPCPGGCRDTTLRAGPGCPGVTVLLQDGTQERESLRAPAPSTSSLPHRSSPPQKHHRSGPCRKGPDGSEQPLRQCMVTASPAPRSWCIPALI